MLLNLNFYSKLNLQFTLPLQPSYNVLSNSKTFNKIFKNSFKKLVEFSLKYKEGRS